MDARNFLRAGIIVAALALAGCGTILTSERYDGGSGERRPRSELTIHGTYPTTKKDIEDINLLYLLDPDGKAQEHYTGTTAGRARPWQRLELSEKYDLAFRAFDRYKYSQADYLRVRNDIQERMIAASERRCGRFEQHLRQQHSDTNFAIGLATTITAGLGALVPGLRASQNLAGSAAILSGSRAEFNDAYFSNLTVSVIARGISQKRKEEYARLSNLQQQDSTRYPIAAAVKDAVAYDSLCNIVTGLEQANDALTKRDDPGIDAINRTLVRTSVMRLLAANPENSPQALGKLKEMIEQLNATGMNVSQLLPTFPRPAASPAAAGSAAIPSKVSGEAYVRLKDSAATAVADILAKLPATFKPDMTAERNAVKTALQAPVDGLLQAFETYADSCADNPGKSRYKAYLDAVAALDSERAQKSPSDIGVTQLGLTVDKTQDALSYFKSTLDAALKDAIDMLVKYRDGEQVAVAKLAPDGAKSYKPATALTWTNPAGNARASCTTMP